MTSFANLSAWNWLIQFFIIVVVVFALPPLCLGKLAQLDGGSGLMHGFSVFFERRPEGFFDITTGMYTFMYLFITFLLNFYTTSTNWRDQP